MITAVQVQALSDIARGMSCDPNCTDVDEVEFGPLYPCPKCRLRQFIADETQPEPDTVLV